MDIIIQSLGFKAGAELEGYIKEKLGKLNPNDQIVRANVTLFLGPEKSVQNTYCEIRLEVPGNDLFIKENSADFEQSVDTAVNKLQAMMRKSKEKQVDQWRNKLRDITCAKCLSFTAKFDGTFRQVPPQRK